MSRASVLFVCAACLLVGAGGCGDTTAAGPDATSEPDTSHLPYAREVIDFKAGEAAGFGADDMPEVVLGPPIGLGSSQGSLDVLSLGRGGEIVLGFAGRTLVDEPGVDLIVFENAFWQEGDPERPWAELGEVAVSSDGESWTAWPCVSENDGASEWPGCAGWTPTMDFAPLDHEELDPAVTGGDTFDLEDIDVAEARYVRIRDLSGEGDGEAPSAGFDLDAVGWVHAR